MRVAWRVAKALAVVAAIALMAVGAVGVWRLAEARWNPPPAPAPELAADALPPATPRAEACVPTEVPVETRETVLARAREFGLDLDTAGAPEPPQNRPTGWLDYPVTIALGDFGPGPRGDTGRGWCYVPAPDAPGELRVVWTSPPASLAELAGCVAAEGVDAAQDAAAAVKDKLDEVAASLGAEARYALRAGPGYGTGGPGLLVVGSIDGRTRKGHQIGGVGMAWLSRDPAAAAALTVGLDRPLIGKR